MNVTFVTIKAVRACSGRQMSRWHLSGCAWQRWEDSSKTKGQTRFPKPTVAKAAVGFLFSRRRCSAAGVKRKKNEKYE